MNPLANQVAVVTGAGRGIGREVALLLAREGARVIVNDPGVGRSGEPTDERPADDVVGEIRAAGGTAIANYDSVADYQKAGRMVAQCVDAFGKIDILVNVAGTNARFDAEDMPAEEFERVLRVNVLGTFLACQAVGRVMIAQKHGVIVNMSSVRGRVAPGMGGSAYATSKGGVDQLTRTLAAEWAKHGVRVNAVAPALIMTDMTREFLSKPEVYAKMTAEIPMRRLGEPGELIGPIVLLASDESSFMTGQIVYVDGGLSAV
jgi:NAD(P)-dependent dehydrogenase (short-subunit alcohol dehydrogenase family)